ncbi:WD repeat-containing 37 [Brachionus plicatilis]|uniref:WD repeat-containing protein 37 n=1 Tax=Brachionus plicatilis TaxID=10195 RepID=A0A3M7RAQ6_BRAPC|nr:WD repeat-containing 37 [Brachionus plicatilis]
MPLKKYNTSSILASKSAQSDHKSATSSCRNSLSQHQNLANHLYSINDLLPNIIESAVTCSASASATGSASAAVNSNSSNLNTSSSSSASSSGPPERPIAEIKSRLYEIFAQIEREFDVLYLENSRLKQQIEQWEKSGQQESAPSRTANASMNTNSSSSSTLVAHSHFSPSRSDNKAPTGLNNSATISAISSLNWQMPKTSSQTVAKNKINNLSFPKFRPNAREFIMQSIKNTSAQIVNKTQSHSSALTCRSVGALTGHKDGIWDISCVQVPGYLVKSGPQCQNLLLGTASADTTARLWYHSLSSPGPTAAASPALSPQVAAQHQHSSSLCVQEYSGHTGSVNSVRFHPKFFTNSTNLVLSSSGDCQVHVWQCVLSQNVDSMELKNELSYMNCHLWAASAGCKVDEQFSQPSVIRSPIQRFEGHQDACIAAEWFPDGECVASASWDRTANVYNVETGKVLCNLQHDDHLTNVNIHQVHKILLTSSKDTTFKIWDFRDPICSVQIYQAHSRSVNSAIFVGDDKIATSSDDHTVKIWDLRVMRSPVCTINCNSGVNRMCSMTMCVDSASSETYLCLPLDNRDIKIYNMQGERILRLNRNDRVGHRRLVTSLASCGTSLFSASFDKCVSAWSFDYNASKSSVMNRIVSSSNKENSEVILTSGESGQGFGGAKFVDSPSILTQLSNLTSPNNQNGVLGSKSGNATIKSVQNSAKLVEKIKI